MNEVKMGDRVEVVAGPFVGKRGWAQQEAGVSSRIVLLDSAETVRVHEAHVRPAPDPGPFDPPMPRQSPYVQRAVATLEKAASLRGGEQANWAAIGQGYALLALATAQEVR